jgi:hypothetical protein
VERIDKTGKKILGIDDGSFECAERKHVMRGHG